MKLKCAFDYCIYNDNFWCILNKIEINEVGSCENCIIVYLEPETLEEYKRKQLNKLENQ